MTRIGGIGNGVAAPRRAARTTGGFALPGPEGGTRDAAAAAAAGGTAALLALQDPAPAPAGPPGERGRRRARAALEELRGLQLDLLRGVADPARLDRLAALAEAEAEGAPPGLAEALQEVALRVRVELARRHMASVSGM